MKSAITITVRLKSTRLEKKALKKILDKTLIEHLIDRLKLSNLSDMIILCTSTNPQDDPLIDIAKKNGISFFRGSELDVLKRLFDAAKKNDVDFIVSCTGDNPFTDPIYIDKIIESYKKTNADYITALELPFGTFAYGVKVSAIKRILELKKEEDTEVWGQYFNKSNLFVTKKICVEEKHKRPELRLTVDTPGDFNLIEKIYEELYKKNNNFSLTEIITFLDNNPELKQLNENVKQKIPLSIDTKKLINDGVSFILQNNNLIELMNQLEEEKKLSFIYSENPKIIFLNLPPNYEGVEELHDDEDDLYFVLDGSAEFYEEDRGKNIIKKGDFVYVPKKKIHKLKFTKNGIKYLVFKIKK
jgi:spore coat polysaccharide biosynthesis protein SpsF